MKIKLFVFGFTSFVLVTSTVLATVPMTINLQGRLTDVQGNPILIPTQVEFRIYQGGHATVADDGTVVYKEKAVVIPLEDGSYQHFIGAGTPVEGHTLSISDFDTNQEVYLQMMVGGSALLPRLKVGAGAYALVANMAGQAHSVDDGAIHEQSLDEDLIDRLVPAGTVTLYAGVCPSGWTALSIPGAPNFPGFGFCRKDE